MLGENEGQIMPLREVSSFTDRGSGSVALDDDMIASKSQRQKWKSSSTRDDCRQAYTLVAITDSFLFLSHLLF